MLGYQHDYHAGNHADVLKHSVLATLIRALQRKPAALRVIDSHAGSGCYDLSSRAAEHGREFEAGAARVFRAADAPAAMAPYLDVLDAHNADGTLRYYPGSPQIALSLLRPQDQLELFELHPQAIAALRARYGRNPQVHVHARDGFEGLAAIVPPRERRGIALIDPAYERNDEYTRAGDLVATCAKRWTSGVYVVWYPLLARRGAEQLLERLRRLELPRTFRVELEIDPNSEGLRGSGLLIVNLPYEIDTALAALVPWLGRTLRRRGGGPWLAKWL